MGTLSIRWVDGYIEHYIEHWVGDGLTIDSLFAMLHSEHTAYSKTH